MNQQLLTDALLARYDHRAPRYTSYPTVPEWTKSWGSADLIGALERASQSPERPLSLYAHIPFCEVLCTYCGCNVQVSKQVERADPYLEDLDKEVQIISDHLGDRRLVNQLHWGGGTPTFLDSARLERLWRQIFDRFELTDDAEVSVEINPVVTGPDQLVTLRELGFNRLSMGVQTFDPKVQEHIKRVQPFDMTRDQLTRARALGFGGINFDLIYGLPFQTPETWAKTLEQVIRLRPDRLAVFSFAFMPHLRPHQKALDATQMLQGRPKLELFLQARRALLEAGYVMIGFDHFALPDDPLAQAAQAGSLWRNFQGYTVNKAPDSIGFGVTAISDIAGVYSQNVRPLTRYKGSLAEGVLPVERGISCTAEDLDRRALITTLMCALRVDLGADSKTRYAREFSQLQPCFEDGLAVWEDDVLRVTELGRFFLRNIAMPFDTRLARQAPDVGPRFSHAI